MLRSALQATGPQATCERPVSERWSGRRECLKVADERPSLKLRRRRSLHDPLQAFTYDRFVEGYLSWHRRVNVGSGCLRRGLSGPNSIRALHYERECMQREEMRKIAK
jgi:hypothetical protein